MTEPFTVVLDPNLDWSDWTLDELHDYFAAVEVNAPSAEREIAVARGEDFADLARLLIEAGYEPGTDFDAPDDWQPTHILALRPDLLAGFAWIATRRTHPGLTWEEFRGRVRAAQLIQAYADFAFDVPEGEAEERAPESDASPLAASAPKTTSPKSKTSSSSRARSAGRSARSGPSATGSTSQR